MEFNQDDQIWTLISNYSDMKNSFDIHVDIYGLLLDYISRTKKSLIDILIQCPELDKILFDTTGDEKDSDKAFFFLRELYTNYQDRVSLREEAANGNWSYIVPHIDKIDENASRNGLPSSRSFLDKLTGHKVDGVIWQFSDIHFGKFNELKLNPKQLATNLKLVAEFDEEIFSPRLILISGDLTSIASDDEFAAFNTFAEHLSNEIWGNDSSHRILVVPGNHDASWEKDGVADKLKNFNKNITGAQKFTTPFWTGPRKKKDNFGEITINSFVDDVSEDVPPFALVTEKKMQFQVLLLVSSYYSGIIPEKVRKLIIGIKNQSSREALEEICREDTGEMSTDYLLHIKSNLKETNKTTVSLSHHNLEQYGERPCKVPHVKELLSTLSSKNIHIALHGHTHLVETTDGGRTPNGGEAFPIPCPTLCSDREPGSNYGFFMHLIGPNGVKRDITTVCLENNSSRFLNITPDRLKPIYHFTIDQANNAFDMNYCKGTHSF